MWLWYALFYPAALFVGVLIVGSLLRAIGIGRRTRWVDPDAPEYADMSDGELAAKGIVRRPRG